MWESLVLEQGVKNHLLEYASTALLFTGKGVSKNIISWNRYTVGALTSTRTSTLASTLASTLTSTLTSTLAYTLTSTLTYQGILLPHYRYLYSYLYSYPTTVISRNR